MKEYKPAVDLMIENLQMLSRSLEEENFNNTYGYFIICNSAFAMMSKALETKINMESQEMIKRETENDFPDIIENDLEN